MRLKPTVALYSLALDVLSDMNGVCVRLENIHFSTDKRSIHKESDELLEKCRDFKDEFAETIMGESGFKIHPFSLECNMGEGWENLSELISSLMSRLLGVMKLLESHGSVAAKTVVEDFYKTLSKYRYLATFR